MMKHSGEILKRESRVRALSVWTGLFALFFLTVFLLWVPETGYKSIVAPKHRLFLWACGVFFAGMIPAWLLQREKCSLKSLLLLIPAGVLLVLFFLSAWFSEHPDTVWLGSRRNEGFLTLALYLGIYSVMALWGKVGKLHVRAAAVTAALMLLVAALQVAGRNPLGLYPGSLTFHDRNVAYSGEYLSTVGNSDLLSAGLTVLTLFLAGDYAVSGEVTGLVGAFCSWQCLLLSEVSAGFVGVLGCFALCLPLCLRKGIGTNRVGDLMAALVLGLLVKSCLVYGSAQAPLAFSWGLVPTALAALLVLTLAGSVLLHKKVGERACPKTALALWAAYGLCTLGAAIFLLTYRGGNETLLGLGQLLRGNPPDTLGSSRIRIWKEALQLAGERPLLGGGPDTYRFYSTIIFTKELPNGVRQTSVDAAHCEYLNLLVNTGLPSLLAYLWLVLGTLIPGARHLDREKLPLLLPALGYAIHALFGISQSLVSPLYYVFLGLLAGSLVRQREPAAGKK